MIQKVETYVVKDEQHDMEWYEGISPIIKSTLSLWIRI